MILWENVDALSLSAVCVSVHWHISGQESCVCVLSRMPVDLSLFHYTMFYVPQPRTWLGHKSLSDFFLFNPSSYYRHDDLAACHDSEGERWAPCLQTMKLMILLTVVDTLIKARLPNQYERTVTKLSAEMTARATLTWTKMVADCLATVISNYPSWHKALE